MELSSKKRKEVFSNETDSFSSSPNASVNRTFEIQKNPMLLSPLIKCVLGFLNIREVKNCRLLCREWALEGKVVLTRRGLVSFRKDSHLPIDFHSCFLESSTLFNSFSISGFGPDWMIEELAEFFAVQEGSIKELTLLAVDFYKRKEFDISPWISKSPMIKQDTKQMTKLSIDGDRTKFIIPLGLLAHIKEVTLSQCRINIEANTQMHPVKLKLKNIIFYQNGIKLFSIEINDIVNFDKAEEVQIGIDADRIYQGSDITQSIVINVGGIATLKKLVLESVQVEHWELSRWVVTYLRLIHVRFPLKTLMVIKELHFSESHIDLFSLPNSIEKLALDDVFDEDGVTLSCSKPIMLENLKYLNVTHPRNYSFLLHFINCPQLTHLKLKSELNTASEMQSNWMPKSVKTLMIEDFPFNWVDIDRSYLDLDKLIFRNISYRDALGMIMCHTKWHTKIQANEIVMDMAHCHPKITKHEDLSKFLKYQKLFSFAKHCYVGWLKWEEDQEVPTDSFLKNHVDVDKSAFYVFENAKKGRALTQETFYELADFPEHIG